MHGCGNDFIMIENTAGLISIDPDTIAKLCDRHKGIGADGLILVERKNSRFFMNYYNSDGSTAKMCGNGMRCFAAYLDYFGFLDQKNFEVETRGGLIPVDILDDGMIRVKIGKANYDPESLPVNIERFESNRQIQGKTDNFLIEDHEQNFQCGALSIPNPHLILLNKGEDQVFYSYGPKLEKLDIFPEGVNVSFVQPTGKTEFSIRTWERGAGETLACGTGTSAAFSWLYRNGLVNGRALAHLPGGDLFMEMTPEGDVLMTGPAKMVYSGAIETESLRD